MSAQMKRLAWLIILVFGTALAQVSPLDLGNPQHKVCSCCDTPGDCGAPACELSVACVPNNFVCESTDRAARELAPQNVAELNGVSAFPTLDTVSPRRAYSTPFSRRARVSLFKVHCSFVI